MYKVLEKYIFDRFMISVYDNRDDVDEFFVGYCIGISESYCLFNLITTRGYEDGYYLTMTDDIYKINDGDNYSKKIKNLFENLNQKLSKKLSVSDDLVKDLLLESQRKNYIVSLAINDTVPSLTGFISSIDEEFINVEIIDDYGNADGQSIIEKSDITRIYCNSGNERNLGVLFEYNKKRNCL